MQNKIHYLQYHQYWRSLIPMLMTMNEDQIKFTSSMHKTSCLIKKVKCVRKFGSVLVRDAAGASHLSRLERGS